ncbi:MAG: tRNA pseudouridine38-40 synthase [Sulfurimonas sp.]|jgi:tRNA pseudouridine38-40 synthase|uniref:tRNA pseudouridine(38-40) synthase TruA n=1 Tax=Sulfurimonas sp. TaxID=2022749 RepID=UPI0039E6258E
MYYHRLIISYKGTSYFGWQELGINEQKPTVQASIQQVLNKICKHKSCSISTASRTDAGVHAQGQVVKITIPLAIESEKLLLGMNSLLPGDIRILQCQPCSAEFNPNRDSKSKEYHYYFCTDTIYNPVFNDTVTHTGSLDIELMRQASQLFIGEHDFYSFAKRDTKMDSTFRTVLSCEILKAPSSTFTNEIYYLKIVGKGFLRHMVRYIAGALFALGKNQLSLSTIGEALVNRKEEKISSRAKSRGLHLIQISY